MGQCYVVKANLHFVSEIMEQRATKKLREHLYAELNNVVEGYSRKGLLPDTFRDCMNILLSDQDFQYSARSNPCSKFVEVYSCFDGSYGWESAIEDGFKAICPYLADGSYLDIFPDSGYTHCIARDGMAELSVVDEQMNPYFDNAEEFMDSLSYSSYGFYNTNSELFIIQKDDSIQSYHVSQDKVTKICENIRKIGDTDTAIWLQYLEDADRKITLNTDSEEAFEYLDKVNPEDDNREAWIPACPFVDIICFQDIKKIDLNIPA